MPFAKKQSAAENAENAGEEHEIWKNPESNATGFAFPALLKERFFPALPVFSAVNFFLLSAAATAQQPARDPAPKGAIEGRADVIVSQAVTAHAGIGFTVKTGTYLRSGFDAGLGAGSEGISGRIDFVNRFHLDPFRQFRWAPYAGGGLTARFDDNRKNQVYLLIFLGIDGPARKGLGTSIEAGLGGGGRIGIIIRQAAAERR